MNGQVENIITLAEVKNDRENVKIMMIMMMSCSTLAVLFMLS